MLDEGFYPPFLHTYEVSATTIVAKSQGKILRIAKIPKVDGFTLFAKKPWHNSRQWIGNDSLNTTSANPLYYLEDMSIISFYGWPIFGQNHTENLNSTNRPS